MPAFAGDPAFSDPANVTPAPSWAVGQANRSPKLDVLPGFQQPPKGFGVVPFFWWLGDPLTKERLGWILEQMSGMGISDYQINYAHDDNGGAHSFGRTYPSDPPLYSEAWWKLVGWFMQEAKKQGSSVSLSDYTLGLEAGYSADEVVREHPEVQGMTLRVGRDGKVAPAVVPNSINPMHPMAGKWYAGKFFGQFERRFPGEAGKGFNFFFSDELNFGVPGNLLWSANFAEEFKKRKGYDITPELPALFKDIGPRTPKVRMDYGDVMVSLSEEGYFKPIFDWHQQRGMTMGTDHCGRGQDVAEFGDYFRTHRWYQGPGADQPNMGKNLIKAKVNASIAHLYERPRVWLEGYYSSGWGTPAAGLVDATFVNFVRGYNLLTFHGMYYSTHGGYWEWAPPDNTFRMPYWKHTRSFMECVQRLSYILTQGYHRCDVAILYPVAAMEAGMDGKEAAKTAFDTAEKLYRKGVDFDFMDYESLDRAKIVGKELHVSGEAYRVLVLPAMKAIRHSTLQKALEFHRAGGIVLAPGALPEASDRIGRDDPEVAAMVKELFPEGPTKDVFAQLPGRDYEGPGEVQHRKLGKRDLYAVYNAPKGAECYFRATGEVELWDPWTGATKPLAVTSQTAEGTKLKLPLTQTEIQLIVFSPGKPQIATASPAEVAPSKIAVGGDWEFELKPTLDNRFGDFRLPVTEADKIIGPEARIFRHAVEQGDAAAWRTGSFDDSQWERVTYGFGPQFWLLGPLPEEAAELAKLARVNPQEPVTVGGKAYSWRPYSFSWRMGLEGDPGHQGFHGLKESVTDHFICLGKSAWVSNEHKYKPEPEGNHYYLWTSATVDRETTARILASVRTEGKPPHASNMLTPASVFLNGTKVDNLETPVTLRAGANPLLVHYSQAGRGYFVMKREGPEQKPQERTPLAMSWYDDASVIRFDVHCGSRPAEWFRFVAPPGFRAMTFAAKGKVEAWADGQPMRAVGADRYEAAAPLSSPAVVALRITPEPGVSGGSVLNDPIRLDCVPGLMALGDWSKNSALECYSGGAWYRKTVTLTPEQTRGAVTLDLGKVCASAEVRVNGQPAGIRIAPPWTFDITKLAKAGENRIEVLVCSTLGNHYMTIPTHYRKYQREDQTAGLLGPVTIEIKVSNTPPNHSTSETDALPTGGRLEKTVVEGRTLTLKIPAKPAPGKPWLWVGEFGGHLGAFEDGLVAAGWHVAYVGASNMFGSPRAMAIWEKVYAELVGRRGLAAKPALLGISRGGMYVTAWARLHPDRVGILYLDNAVCDARSWPGGIQLTARGVGSAVDWNLYKQEFNFATDDEAEAKSIRPVDGLEPLIKKNVLLVSVHGTADRAVPFVDNTAPVVALWEKNGGRVKVFPKEGGDHHPHGLKDPRPLIDLFCDEMKK
ncbi:MAG: glycosyl hydrolase [Verrucomicrobiota bacterium]